MASDRFNELFPPDPDRAAAMEDARRGGQASAKAAADRREQFIQLFVQHYPQASINDLCKMMGVSRRSYENWRKVDDFRQRIDEYKQQLRLRDTDGQSTWDGSFADFRLKYLGRESYYYHTEMARVLDHAPEGSISMILLPPGAGKTTTLEDWMMMKLAVDPDHRILFISESQGEASKRLQNVQRHMSDANLAAPYITRFGPFYEDGQERSGKPWTGNHFTVAKRESGERDYSLAAVGMSSQIYGIRADTIILDDVQTMKSINQTDSYLARFRQEILSRRPSGGAKGRVVIIATRVAEGDFYERLIEEELIDDGQLIKMPCTRIDPETGQDVPLCPEMYPPEIIPRVKKQAGDSWWTAYQQEPRLAANVTFTEDMVQSAKDPLRKAGEVRKNEHVVIGVDPALQGNTGLVVLAYTPTSISVVDCVQLHKPESQERILDEMETLVARYRPLDVVIETMAYQQALYNDDRFKQMGYRYGFRPRSHKTYGNKHDPLFGVSGMARSFHLGELKFPAGDDHSWTRIEPLISELRSWRPDIQTKLLQQDMVMAMWFAWKHIQEHGRRTADASLADQFSFKGLADTYKKVVA